MALYQKGQSGNLSGRPKGTGILGALMRDLEIVDDNRKANPLGLTNRERVAQAMVRRAITGGAKDAALLLSYTDGKPRDLGLEDAVQQTVSLNILRELQRREGVEPTSDSALQRAAEDMDDDE